ncbi:EndoU domain-containing protein [Dryocola sp. BD613]|uniref:EndoU domain-containing protein n=1 Tax=Dryocola sp. BD613 TaxID=3133272 RepID=UPI003F506026
MKAQTALGSYDGSASYNLKYKDIFPEDYANASAIMQGLDAGSITRDAAIVGIAEKTGKPWLEVAKTYDDVMQLHAIASIIAGSKMSGDELVPGKSAAKPDAVRNPEVTISPGNQKYVDILSPEAKQHILYGDSPTQGGHLYPGNSGKTVFPKEWSADKVVHEIGDIVTSPNTKWFAQSGTGGNYTAAGQPARWVAWEEREGVRVRVVYEPANGKVITAFPDDKPTPPALKPIKK